MIFKKHSLALKNLTSLLKNLQLKRTSP